MDVLDPRWFAAMLMLGAALIIAVALRSLLRQRQAGATLRRALARIRLAPQPRREFNAITASRKLKQHEQLAMLISTGYFDHVTQKTGVDATRLRTALFGAGATQQSDCG
ncbi:MAG: hypothetical protein ACR2GY_01415 [Phycisphaerales bacterium]